MSRKIETVAVVGRDAAAWITALGLQRAFGRTGVAVRVVELPSQLADIDVYPALPSLAGLHKLLGVEEEHIVAACRGVYALGQRFANWSGGKAPFVHAYDTQPIGLNNVDLVQYWVKARSEGMPVEFDEFSLGAAMAKHGRAPLLTDPSDSFSRPAHGYHLSAAAYAGYMKHRAIRSGVGHVTAVLADVRIEGDRVAAVLLEDGQTVEADLFIDATGAEAALIGRLPGSDPESWRQWLPCDRVLAASTRRLDPLPGFSQIAAFRAGWIGLYPLQDRTAMVATYDSGQASDDEVLQGLGVLTGLKPEGEVVVSSLAVGARRAWIGNCIAVGEAAAVLEPLDAVSLHMVHIGLSHLVGLFPVDADSLTEAAAYNAVVASHARNVRDFQIAHYRLNQRRDEPFWDRARDMPTPERLDYKMRLFAGRGRIAQYDDETFEVSNWTSIFVGHGLVPRDYDPLVDMLPPAEQIQQLQKMLRFVAEEVKAMPSLQSALDRRPRATGAGLF